MSLKLVLRVGALAAVVGMSTGWAQETPAPAPEAAQTPAAGTALPDQEQVQPAPAKRSATNFKSWDEMVEDWLTPRPVPKDTIVRVDEKHA